MYTKKKRFRGINILLLNILEKHADVAPKIQ